MEKKTSLSEHAGAMRLNETHDPALKSFVEAANDPATSFPLQNLPFAVFRRAGTTDAFQVGVGIGDQVLEVAAVQEFFEGKAREAAAACGSPSMNALMDLGAQCWSALRLALSRLLREDSQHVTAVGACLVPMGEVEFVLPVKIPHFTDYAASLHHVLKVTQVVRPEDPHLEPQMKWNPVGFHSRASTVRTGPHTFLRPQGQLGYMKDGVPAFGPSQKLDYEAEMGIYVSQNTEMGKPLTLDQAEDVVFGVTVLNDWTARDLMFWERLPLGPYLSKNFASTVSPWVVTMEAMEPFRRAWSRTAPDPDPLPNLDSAMNRQRGGLDIHVEVLLQTPKSEAAGYSPTSLSVSNTRDMYWTVSQIVAHHTSTGCSLEQGDLIGTGTISGPGEKESGCMFELTLGGREAVQMPTGERRGFVEDGDTLIIRAYCESDGYRKIGFGDATSMVLAND